MRWRGPATFEDFDEWIAELWTLRWTAVALMAAVCVAVSFGALLHVKQREQQAFDNAPICALATDRNCTLEYAATVQDKGSTSGKMPTYYLDLAGPQPADGTIDLPRENALWDSAASGDTVTAIVWNGAVVSVIDGTVVGDTAAAPALQTTIFVALFASSVFWVLASAMFFLRMLQMDRGILASWSRVLVPLNLVAMAGIFLFPLGALPGSQWESALGVVLTGLALTAFGAIIVVVTWLRNR
jgi:hypothetical protein